MTDATESSIHAIGAALLAEWSDSADVPARCCDALHALLQLARATEDEAASLHQHAAAAEARYEERRDVVHRFMGRARALGYNGVSQLLTDLELRQRAASPVALESQPSGWALAPTAATIAMIEAGMAAAGAEPESATEGSSPALNEVYRAMLAAAPKLATDGTVATASRYAWADAPDWARWAGSDADGSCWFYSAEPDLGNGCWVATETALCERGWLSAWTRTLEARPLDPR